MALEVGIFDQIYLGRLSQPETVAGHIAFVEAAERLGVARYHVTEHHGAPLTIMQPNVILAALTQRTTRIRLGVLVNILPAHHPLALAEEIASLDLLSGGRIDVGVGSGVVPYELANVGVHPARSRAIFAERLPLLRGLLETGRDGELELIPAMTQSEISYWYASANAPTADWAAREGINLVGWWTGGQMAEAARAYHAARAESGATPLGPGVGLAGWIIVGESDQEATDRFHRAWATHGERMLQLWHRHGDHGFDFFADSEMILRDGIGIAGSAATVRELLADRLVGQMGSTYFEGHFFFGDLVADEAIASLDRFMTEVAPRL